jgi:putative endonuclease
MRDHEIIVFIEVRARAGKQVVSALETIDPGKCRRIIKAGNHFLQKYRLGNSTFFRFDVVILQGGHGDYEIDWIRNAFET